MKSWRSKVVSVSPESLWVKSYIEKRVFLPYEQRRRKPRLWPVRVKPGKGLQSKWDYFWDVLGKVSRNRAHFPHQHLSFWNRPQNGDLLGVCQLQIWKVKFSSIFWPPWILPSLVRIISLDVYLPDLVVLTLWKWVLDLQEDRKPSPQICQKSDFSHFPT